MALSAFSRRHQIVLAFDAQKLYYLKQSYAWAEIGGIELLDSRIRTNQGGEISHEALDFIAEDGKMLFGLGVKSLKEDSLTVWGELTEQWHKQHPAQKMRRLTREA